MEDRAGAPPESATGPTRPSRPARLAIAAALVFVFHAPATSDSNPGAQFTVVTYREQVESSSVAYITLRVMNTGDRPIRGCGQPQKDEVLLARCVALGWRFWKTPSPPRLTNMDVVHGLPPNVTLQPGQSMQRIVRVETPARHARGSLNLYLFVRDGADVAWQHASAPISVTSAMASHWPRILPVWALCASFLATVAGCVWSALRGGTPQNGR
jgi:hypothetical protein